ncbi:hypothetical protein XELAEV_18044406mg [Xenopus laevis]|uniref:Cytochrome P450 27C1 n=2 Tax=Xenopus laevis TaxID=8355 RepID=A0A974BYQ2_XENLA|nr:hypothetical protein XELAEV_18044406mg [Xenopus laevis]
MAALGHLLKGSVRLELEGLARGFHQFPVMQAAEQALERNQAEVVLGPRTKGAPMVKSLNDMPGPSTLANLVEFFWRDGFGRIQDIQQKHTRQYGRIFKSHFGPQFVVSIADKDLVAQVLRAERDAPQRANMESWHEYRELRGRSTGLISAEGEKWLNMRSVLRQKILRPRDVAMYSGGVNEVIDDLVNRIRKLRAQESDGLTVTNVNDLYFKYSMEAIATILYECRLGCLDDKIPQMTKEYIEALELMFSMFKTTMYAGAIPKWLRPIIPKPWREFCRSWDGLFKFSQIHVENRLQQIESQLNKGEEVQGGVLTHLLLTKELDLEEIYANMTEMLLAGVDTTSFTLSWATYLLAKNPSIQESVYQQIVQNLEKDQVPTAEDVPKIPLVRAVVKETLRLFPVLPGNGRVTQDDLVLDGYLIPKGTQLALCHYSTSFDDKCFPAAEEFKPERWIRSGNLERKENFGSIPFGYGIRSCIGRRIAELELHLLLIQLLQNFEIKVSPKTTTVLPKTHGLLCPGEKINVRFVDRH